MIEVPNNLCTFSKYLMIDYSMFINCCISYRDGSNEIPTPQDFLANPTCAIFSRTWVSTVIYFANLLPNTAKIN